MLSGACPALNTNAQICTNHCLKDPPKRIVHDHGYDICLLIHFIFSIMPVTRRRIAMEYKMSTKILTSNRKLSLANAFSENHTSLH